MTKEEFVKYVKDLKGAKIITLFLETKPKLNKNGVVNGVKQANPYFDKITKQSLINGMINFDYEGGVNRLRDKVAGAEKGTSQFKAGHHAWSTANAPVVKEKNNSIIERNGETYLQFRIQKTLKTKYLYQGKEIAEALIKPFLPPKNSGSNPGEEKINIISPNIKSIKRIIFKQMGHIFEKVGRRYMQSNVLKGKKKAAK